MNRAAMLNHVRKREKIWDFIIIGGGATGAGCAVDAASRGFDVLLLEQSDFGKGTSSRSTKLVHGGVRYLAQGNLSLVREALKERGILRENAAHLVKNLAFIVPCYSLWQKFFYGVGLKIYDFLAGKRSFGKSKILSRTATLEKLPNIARKNLRGGIIYFDGQFDDARLLIDLIKTAADCGATVLNYAPVFELTKDAQNKINGVKFQDAETGEEFTAKAQAVINATGAFCDAVRRMADKKSVGIIAPSQGVHLVFDNKFLPSENALMIPKTSDKRVLFAIPWHGKTLIGTTDTPINKLDLEPQAFDEEIEFILKTAADYLENPPRREDILSIFVGIRPLVKSGETKNSAAISRDHTIEFDASNLLTVTGGKWTTYRQMAEDAVNQAIEKFDLPPRICITENLKIHDTNAADIRQMIRENPETSGAKLHPDLPLVAAEVIYAVRVEMAKTVEDVLARRARILFLDANAAIEIAPQVAEIMAREMNRDDLWITKQIENFRRTAENYLP